MQPKIIYSWSPDSESHRSGLVTLWSNSRFVNASSVFHNNKSITSLAYNISKQWSFGFDLLWTTWLHHTWQHTANQHHLALVGLICDPPRLANSTFLTRRLTMGREVLLSMDQLSGTAYPLNFGHLTSRWTFSKPSWRHFCLTADLAHLMYLF